MMQDLRLKLRGLQIMANVLVQMKLVLNWFDAPVQVHQVHQAHQVHQIHQ